MNFYRRANQAVTLFIFFSMINATARSIQSFKEGDEASVENTFEWFYDYVSEYIFVLLWIYFQFFLRIKFMIDNDKFFTEPDINEVGKNNWEKLVHFYIFCSAGFFAALAALFSFEIPSSMLLFSISILVSTIWIAVDKINHKDSSKGIAMFIANVCYVISAIIIMFSTSEGRYFKPSSAASDVYKRQAHIFTVTSS